MIDLFSLSGVQALRILGLILVAAAISALVWSFSDTKWQTDINAIAARFQENFAARSTKYGAGCYATDELVSANILPPNIVSGTTAVNEWGGTYVMCGATQTLWIFQDGVPRDQCQRMLLQARSITRVVSVFVAANMAALQAAGASPAGKIATTTDISTTTANSVCASAANGVGFEVR